MLRHVQICSMSSKSDISFHTIIHTWYKPPNENLLISIVKTSVEIFLKVLTKGQSIILTYRSNTRAFIHMFHILKATALIS